MQSMDSSRKLANAFGGKSARACDNCIKKRARWYCAADDAFLCESCDSCVHSANSLARRHERVRLKASSINSADDKSKEKNQISGPSWHQGFTRKARTPRQKKHGKLFYEEPIGMINNNPLHLVPEICSEEQSHEENEEQLLYRVPIFDPFVAELCTSANSNEVAAAKTARNDVENRQTRKSKAATSSNFTQEINHFDGILPSEMDLAEFAADVESLLCKGLEDESFDMEGLGLLDCNEKGKESNECFWPSGRVKVEQVAAVAQENHQNDVEFDLGRETFELNLDYEYSLEEEQEYKAHETEERIVMMNNYEDCKVDIIDSNKTFLKLNYNGIMSAWDEQKSPWTTGERPELNSGGCWRDCLGISGAMHLYGEIGMKSGHAATDGGREARVCRYREKRRRRLFSKKIRYEVRKLNAEKRPRMKGRFVKRTNLGAPANFALLNK